MNKTERHIRYMAIVIMVVAFPLKVSAQWNFDIVSVEAYINDHKQQRSLLLARSTLELSNQLLHEYSSEAAVDFKELNVDLDKYTRAFDVIDILYHLQQRERPSRRLQRFAGRLLYESGGTEQDGTDGYTDYRHQLAVCAEDCRGR